MYESYLNQSGMAYRQQNDPYRRNNVRTKTDSKNSAFGVNRTADLPGAGSGKISPGGMGSAISIDNEEKMVNVKGIGQMKKTQAEKLSLKLIDEILNLTQKKSFSLLPAKLEMLQSIIASLQ